MILAKPYLTSEGARKRASFETAVSKTHDYHAIRFLDGVLDKGAVTTELMNAKRYTWRIEKLKRRKA
jgi:hypothetical protein